MTEKDNIDLELDDIIDPEGEELIDIDMDSIDNDSIESAKDLINNLSRYQYDDDFLDRNPSLKKRIDGDIESLRILMKMRKSDEITHDVLIKAIAKNSSNASLYRSLSEIQKTIIQITAKIMDIVNSLNGLLKSYQLEINYNQKDDAKQDSEQSDMHKGSKAFIESMIENE